MFTQGHDRELDAIGYCLQAIGHLKYEEQKRIIEFLVDKYIRNATFDDLVTHNKAKK
jgi:hypothetical protein